MTSAHQGLSAMPYLELSGVPLTWVPGLCFQWDKLYAEKALIDIENCGHDYCDGEVFLDKRVVQVERLLDELSIVVSVVPCIELSIERIPFLRMFFLLQCE